MVDATKVSKIKIDTGYAGVKEYPVFSRPDGKTAQCAIILGRNGTGKSTLARALSVDIRNTEFFDKDGNSLGHDCSNVYIFDESYVIKKFRMSDPECIDPIILLGNFTQRELDIEQIRLKILNLKNELDNVKEIASQKIFKNYPDDILIDPQGFTIKNYVDACIDNDIDRKISDDDELDYLEYSVRNVFRDNGLNNFSYTKWLAQGNYDSQEAVVDMDDNYSEYTVDDIQYEMFEKCGNLKKELNKMNKSASNYEAVGDAENLLSLRFDYVDWILFYIYKKHPGLHFRFGGSFIWGVDLEDAKRIKLEIIELEGELQEKIKLLELERKASSVEYIIEFINQCLRLAFGEGYIYLEPSDSLEYRVKRKAESGNGELIIHPRKLSVGEQNILSLCYFFATLARDGKLGYSMMENQIVVLDDPVSSFDDSNKYGVTSLLGYLCQSVLSKASKTKLIIMTHDLSFAANMEKMIKAIDDSKLSCLELQKDSSNVFRKSKFKDIDRYADMLGIMYDFAVSSQKSAVVPAPNDVRRVWEAFLMFELGETSIANMDSLKKMSGCFSKNQKIERFMRVFIPQLFINNDSHAKSQVMNGNLYLTPTLEGKPYEDFVKNIVCFMHLVSPRHIAWRMKKTQEENVHESVAKLDNLVREVLDDPKIVAATSSWQGIQGIRRARHRGGRVPLEVRRQIAKR
ncbi:AAA family ATPase [uncultured Rothia sp.]|uniref:AAA family ATPase n=1 Tax=uncultured Rothia sp. TaxID=316088 RepID=UPI0028D38421|nr:AAA family ATPase [uncultured Rothia sp.]